MATKPEVIINLYKKLEKELGRNPSVEEVRSGGTGKPTLKYIRKVLSEAGLELSKPRGGLKEAILQAHTDLTKKLGKPPTTRQIDDITKNLSKQQSAIQRSSVISEYLNEAGKKFTVSEAGRTPEARAKAAATLRAKERPRLGQPRKTPDDIRERERYKTMEDRKRDPKKIKRKISNTLTGTFLDVHHPFPKKEKETLRSLMLLDRDANRAGIVRSIEEQRNALIKEQNILLNRPAKNQRRLLQINALMRRLQENLRTTGYGGYLGFPIAEPGKRKPKYVGFDKSKSIAGLETGEKMLDKNFAKVAPKQVLKILDLASKNTNNMCLLVLGKKGNAAGGPAGCATEMAQALDEDPVGMGNKIKDLKVEGGAVNRVKSAASAFLKFASKGKVFGVTAGLGVGAGALVKKFMNDDPSTYLTNDKQANAMILDTIDQKERQERMDAIGDAPELLDEARIAGEVGVTAAAIPGASSVYQARKKPFTRMVDGVKKTRPAMGTARAALGPVGKALSGFATPAGIAALTPLNVASSLYEGDSGYEIATDPLNYLAPALAGSMGSLSKEATRGMGATSKLAKTLRLGMSPGAIKMISRRFGLPGLALSSGISLYELADEYKSGRGMFGKKE